MECLTKQALTEYKIAAPDESIRAKIKAHWDDVAKPLDGMGDFEDLICRIGAIQKSEDVKLDKLAVFLLN